MSDPEPSINTPPPRPERKATVRWGQRELSRISLIVAILIVTVLLFASYRVFRGFKSHRDVVIAKDNLLTLYKALRGYSLDYEGRFPPAENWTDTALGYLSAPPSKPGGREGYLSGPGDGENVGYVYNDLAAGYSMEDTGQSTGKQAINPSNLVLLIERVGAPRNAHVNIPPLVNDQAREALYKAVSFPHYADDEKNATTVILFADGDIKVQTRQDLQQ